MKYILMMNATRENFDWYSKWPKEDLQKNIAFMRNFNKELKDAGVLVSSERASLAPAPVGVTETMPLEVRQVLSSAPEEFL